MADISKFDDYNEKLRMLINIDHYPSGVQDSEIIYNQELQSLIDSMCNRLPKSFLNDPLDFDIEQGNKREASIFLKVIIKDHADLLDSYFHNNMTFTEMFDLVSTSGEASLYLYNRLKSRSRGLKEG